MIAETLRLPPMSHSAIRTVPHQMLLIGSRTRTFSPAPNSEISMIDNRATGVTSVHRQYHQGAPS